jgi:hypothetical protein
LTSGRIPDLCSFAAAYAAQGIQNTGEKVKPTIDLKWKAVGWRMVKEFSLPAVIGGFW